MLDTELSANSPRARDRRRTAALASEHEDVLLLLTTLRGASGDSLHALYFARTVARRAAFRRLNALVHHAILARQVLPDSRVLYRLAGAALSLSPRVRARVSDAARKPLAEDDAGYCWLRSALWAELTKRGFTVGRGRDELLALRRFLVDEQSKRAQTSSSAARVLAALRAEPTLIPLFRSRCTPCRWDGPLGESIAACPTCRKRTEQHVAERRFECAKCGHASDRAEEHDTRGRDRRRCSATMREVDHLSFDVAWRTSNGVREVMLVFVDDPGRDLTDQLRALPLRIAGQPRIPIVLRTTDAASVFDRQARAWTGTGERHRALLRAFSDAGDKHNFPFATTAEVVDINPGLQLRLSQYRRMRKDNKDG